MSASASSPKQPSLRDKLNDHTRELILEALVGMLADGGLIDFSFFELGRRAGVSPRTIYRHFATRDDLFSALTGYINQRLGFSDYPRDVDGVLTLARGLFAHMDANESLMIAQIESPGAEPIRSQSRTERATAITGLVAEVAPKLTTDEQREVAAVVHCLLSSATWHRTREDFVFNGEQTGVAVAHAIEVLIHDAISRSAARTKTPRKRKASS